VLPNGWRVRSERRSEAQARVRSTRGLGGAIDQMVRVS